MNHLDINPSDEHRYSKRTMIFISNFSYKCKLITYGRNLKPLKRSLEPTVQETHIHTIRKFKLTA